MLIVNLKTSSTGNSDDADLKYSSDDTGRTQILKNVYIKQRNKLSDIILLSRAQSSHL